MEIPIIRVVILCIFCFIIVTSWICCYLYSKCHRTWRTSEPHREMPNDVITPVSGNNHFTAISLSSTANNFQYQQGSKINHHKDVLPPSYDEVMNCIQSRSPPSYTSVLGEHV